MNQRQQISPESVAANLAALYEKPFGGKQRGRFRISVKLIRDMLDQRRIWPDQTEAIRRALYELGYVLHDMDTYWVVVSVNTFVSYRRVNAVSLGDVVRSPSTSSLAEEGGDLEEAAE